MAITNTLKNSKMLKNSEFSSSQAEALAEVVESAVSHVRDEMKADIQNLKADMNRRFGFIQWTLIFGIAFLGAMIAFSGTMITLQ